VPIKLSVEIISPLGPDDQDLLTGVSIMTLAIANHEMAKEHFPGVFPGEEAAEEQPKEEPLPCLAPGQGADAGKACTNVVGHRGRHRFRFILPTTEGMN